MLRSKLAEEEGGGREETGSPSDTHEPVQRRVSDATDKIPVRSKERKVNRNSSLVPGACLSKEGKTVYSLEALVSYYTLLSLSSSGWQNEDDTGHLES